MKEILLEAKEIIKTYSTTQEPVLNGISTEIYKGDFTIIMGPSGAGKSTLLYALSGMDNINGGKVLYKNNKLSNLSEKKMAKLRSSDFGFIFQKSYLVSNLTLFENVLVAGYIEKSQVEKSVSERAKYLFHKMHLDKAKNRFPSQVSGGEAQRAAIARAVINKPQIIFADEPTGALNRKNSEDVMNLLTSLNKEGQSILMVTHDIKTAVRGNRILYLDYGKIIDEICLPKFNEQFAKEREEKVSKWLISLSW